MGNLSLAKLYVNPDNKAYQLLEMAEKASELTRGLTAQLLTFAKGGAPVKKVESIARIITDSAGFVLRGSNVRCAFTLPSELWEVEVDPGQMSQVINNLIINADQAMADGGVITVRAENSFISAGTIHPLREGRYVHIVISDQGDGIPEENLTKIFDPYFTTKSKGSGLGLASVYSIIMKHDGYVTVESLPGQGTTFHLYLPASNAAPAGDQPLSQGRKQGSGSGRLMVMDDEDVVRSTARDILEHLGYHVDLCADGTAALDLYREALAAGRPYRAVFMDLTIPGGMGGKVAMKKLLEIDRNAKGIVISGYSNDPILARYREYGFGGVVAKPFNVEEIVDLLANLDH
jgi:CheY-like chemotaxis protein